jgi:hypothetical protein
MSFCVDLRLATEGEISEAQTPFCVDLGLATGDELSEAQMPFCVALGLATRASDLVQIQWILSHCHRCPIRQATRR